MEQLPYLPKEQQELILNGPAMAAPTGVTPDFESPPNNNALGHGVTALCIVIGSLCFLVRLYARVIRLRKFHIEDGLMIVAYIFFVAYVWDLYTLMYKLGIFVHQWDILVKDLITLQYILHIGGTFYSVTLGFLKAAILLEWSRVFVPMGTRNMFWWVCNILAAMQVAFVIATVTSLQVGCRPIEKNWDITVKGTCFKKANLELATAIISLTFDVVILILPQRVIWELHMNLKQKLSVALIFSVGVLACVSASWRLVVTLTYTEKEDVTYNVAPLALWALAECTCGFLVFCVPSAPKAFTERGVFTALKNSFMSWTGMSSSMKSTSKIATAGSSHYNTGSGMGSRNDDYLPMDNNAVAMGKLGITESTEELRVSANKGGNIVRTTQFSTSEDYVETPQRESNFSRQHPWSNERTKRGMV